jgi:hypothetical protein
VHTFPSLQVRLPEPWQLPPPQVSVVVQGFPSLQGLELFTYWQPRLGEQESLVQRLASSQLSAGPGWQEPPEQVSLAVHALPSLQAAVLLVKTQPVSELQESSVQTLESAQFNTDPGTQVPPAQVSLAVHALPSLQARVLFV